MRYSCHSSWIALDYDEREVGLCVVACESSNFPEKQAKNTELISILHSEKLSQLAGEIHTSSVYEESSLIFDWKIFPIRFAYQTMNVSLQAN